MRLAIFLFQNLGATFAKVGQMHETDGLRLEHLLCGDALACEGPWCRGLAFFLGFHLLYWRIKFRGMF
jgi:hypothetical protein